MRQRQHLQSSFHRQTRQPEAQFFQRGTGLVALFRSVAGGLRLRRQKSPAQQINDYVSQLRGSFRGEVSSLLAASLLAKKSLDTTKQVPDPFPEEYFDGSAEVDDKARARLTAYAQDLQALRGDMLRFNSIFSVAVAKGLRTWIVSIHALADPELMPKGREAWALLMRGEEGLEEAYRMLLRRKLSDVERVYLGYRPSVFLTGEPVQTTPAMRIG